MIRSIFALLGLFISTSSFAQMRFLVPNDQDYFVNDEGSYRYIYTASERALLPELIKYNQLFKNIYEKEYNWVFDEQATLVLASTHNQIANGFATPLPRLLTVYYSGGAEIIDEFSVGSWLYTLLSHETSHLYQLNIKRGYAQTLKNTFGPSDLTGAAILPPFTYTELSNAFLPSFLLEGNSTFNESRFGNGGRLYSGASRALLLQMAKAGDITTARLMNEHIEFPFGREKYLIGGFFFLDLARNHGTDAANRYFYNHADYKFNPFNVNDPFIETFGISYNLALKRFLDYWRPMSESQQSAKERPLFTSLAHPGLTKDQNEIRTLTTDGRKLPVARIFNLKTKRWTEKAVNMPMGKLFRDNKNNLVAASSEPINNREKRAGLYGENYRFSKKYLDKYVYDQKAGQMLWANAKSSFVSPDLYTNTKNKQHIGQSSSSGIIGDDQNAYYFKQFAKKRTMMCGQEPLFSFNGFYGVPVEASGARVYFIGPAAWGSSLYYYENKNFFRAHKSDTIIDARIIDEASALVTEITNKGYEYKLVALEPYKESPFEYTYFTEREPHAEILSQSINTPIDTPADDNRTHFKLNEKAYSSFSHWQFNGIDPYIFFGVGTPAVAQLNFRFSDPLQNHSLNMLLSSGSYNEYAAGLHYINSKYVVNWDLLTLFQKTSVVASNPNNPDDYEILDRYDDWLGALGFEYLIYNRTQWQVGLSSHFVYQNESPTLASIDADKKYTVLTQINVAHLVSTPIAYNPYKSLNLDLANEYIRSAPGWIDQRNIYGGEITASYDLFRETYLSASYQAAYTDSPFAIVYFDNGPDDFPYPTPTQVSRNTKYIDQDYFEVRKVSTELKQAINLSFYTTKFPLSLRRMAIFAQYNEYYGATVRREDPGTLFHEAGGGIEMELLLLNKFPFRARWVGYKSSYSDDASSIVVLGANQTF